MQIVTLHFALSHRAVCLINEKFNFDENEPSPVGVRPVSPREHSNCVCIFQCKAYIKTDRVSVCPRAQFPSIKLCKIDTGTASNETN